MKIDFNNFRRFTVIATIVAFSLGSGILSSGCAQRRPSEDNKPPRADRILGSPVVEWSGKGLSSFAPEVQKVTDVESPELLMALSDCDCGQSLVANLVTKKSSARGVLPQVLVPQIRETIASDPKLQILNRLPSFLGDSLKSHFANDEKIAAEVRTSLGKKLMASLRRLGGTKLAMKSPFRFDLFRGPKASTSKMSVNDQVAYWNLILGRSGLWNDQAPLDGVDHGLQLLETTRVAAEWAYIAGIGGDGKPNGLGGLASDVREGHNKIVKPYDIATAPEGAGLFFSGDYEISYSKASSVDLATQVKENWNFTSDQVSLLTQARFWKAAAIAFGNFRRDHSRNTSTVLSEQDGALSPSVGKVPLLWLSGMSELLDKRFIDKNTRIIRETAYGPEAEASLESLVALGEALHSWRNTTKNIESSKMDSAIIDQLIKVPEKMLAPLQLVIQTILSKYTFVKSEAIPKIFVGSSNTMTPEAARLAARTIRFLATVEQGGLASSELRQRVMSLLASHAPLWIDETASTDPATTAELYQLLSTIKEYHDAPEWVAKMKDKYKAALMEWDR